ncbi:MAG: hypothetical protein K0S48_775 [Ramlibacter sp.]|jgi:hypothetical protein|nr:hypothetical protein [Ramlibacter sp.]MCE3272584.1 hypothetical protein [Ramlibacter sp.]
MGLLDLLFGKKPAAAKAAGKRASQAQFAASHSTLGPAGSPHGVRKDLLRLVLRETLHRNGIPAAWLSADLLRTTTTRREEGIHVRFLVREWEPRLMLHGVAFEKECLQRLLLLDPLAGNWLMGFSWQFVLRDASACPPMPHAGSWTAAPPSDPQPRPVPAPQQSGDVIEGPVFIPQAQDDVRGDLERLLALRDEDMKRHDGRRDMYAPTRPATLA